MDSPGDQGLLSVCLASHPECWEAQEVAHTVFTTTHFQSKESCLLTAGAGELKSNNLGAGKLFGRRWKWWRALKIHLPVSSFSCGRCECSPRPGHPSAFFQGMATQQKLCQKFSSLQDGSASAGGFPAQAGENFHTKASLHRINHPFKQDTSQRTQTTSSVKAGCYKPGPPLYFLGRPLTWTPPKNRAPYCDRKALGKEMRAAVWGRYWSKDQSTHHCQNPSLAENTTHSKWKKSH